MGRGGSSDVVRRAQGGDEDAWAELYADHATRLVVWLLHLPRGDVTTDAEDIAAEAWLVAATKIGEFRGSSSDFAGWLFSIARNLARGRGRSSARRRTAPVEPSSLVDRPAAPGRDPAVAAAGHDSTRRLLSRLSEREAQVIACLDVVGLDTAATARALGISAAAVRVARHRGLARLRRVLAEDERSVSAPCETS